MNKYIFVFLASAGFAALPPLAQSTREIQALLADDRFYNSLGSGERIQEIIRTENGYEVTTQHYTMQVEIRYIRGDQKICGPVKFEFEFYQPELRGMRGEAGEQADDPFGENLNCNRSQDQTAKAFDDVDARFAE